MKKIVLKFVRTVDFSHHEIPMSPARRAKYEALINADARAQNAASSVAVYAVSGERALSFRYGVNGRPEIDGGYISPAHTRGMAVCAFGGVPVGCDIERADRGLSGAMQTRFGALDDWLALEACVKMTGEGLAGIRKYHRRGAELFDKSGKKIAYVMFMEYGEYRVALCCGEEFEIEIIE